MCEKYDGCGEGRIIFNEGASRLQIGTIYERALMSAIIDNSRGRVIREGAVWECARERLLITVICASEIRKKCSSVVARVVSLARDSFERHWRGRVRSRMTFL